MGGVTLNRNRLPTPCDRLTPSPLAFLAMNQPPIASARTASPTQTANQWSASEGLAVNNPAMTAVHPMAIAPQPGTEVKEAEDSIARRMKRRLSMACECMSTGSLCLGGSGAAARMARNSSRSNPFCQVL